MNRVTMDAFGDELTKIAAVGEVERGHQWAGALLGGAAGGTAGTVGGLHLRHALLSRGKPAYAALALPVAGTVGGALLGREVGKVTGRRAEDRAQELKQRRAEAKELAAKRQSRREEHDRQVDEFFKKHDFSRPEYQVGGAMWQDPKFKAEADKLNIQEYD